MCPARPLCRCLEWRGLWSSSQHKPQPLLQQHKQLEVLMVTMPEQLTLTAQTMQQQQQQRRCCLTWGWMRRVSH